MGYKNLRECVIDLERNGKLIRIESEVDPDLEVGAIQRRVYQAQGPALMFTRVKQCEFPLLGNLFGTTERMHFLFRDTLDALSQIVRLKTAPGPLLRNPAKLATLPLHAVHLFPRMLKTGPITANRIQIDQLPQLKSWPLDGGAFITLPQVYSESITRPGWRSSNLGMYRVQISGGEYQQNKEVGVHYQIHRGLGIHHAESLQHGIPLRVNIFIGGPPALTLAAVMPLPEGMPELSFAGILGGRRVDMVSLPGLLPVPAEADFCITGVIENGKTLPEGPFGDHLGYYSMEHDFPVLKVENVFCRDGAIWPFTTVGRPPQEDSIFGAFIHELTLPLIPNTVPGVKAVHAVDAAGVHPLLLAVGQERYVPYSKRKPQELLTLANAILGQGQLSLAKYLMIVAEEDNPGLDITDIEDFFRHLLERVDWRCDLHFQTLTTIDTLDYSGTGLNEGSKVVIAAAGTAKRSLPSELPCSLNLPVGFTQPRVCMPGIMAIRGPERGAMGKVGSSEIDSFCNFFSAGDPIATFPLLVIVDDAEFTARTFNNFLWVTFTRSNPAADIYGIGSFTQCKHWGCKGPLVIDARIKPHHAPPLVDDPRIEQRVDALGAPGGPLHGII